MILRPEILVIAPLFPRNFWLSLVVQCLKIRSVLRASLLGISSQEWRLLTAVHTLLQPVKFVSKCFENETTTTRKLYQLKQKFESLEKYI